MFENNVNQPLIDMCCNDMQSMIVLITKPIVNLVSCFAIVKHIQC